MNVNFFRSVFYIRQDQQSLSYVVCYVTLVMSSLKASIMVPLCSVKGTICQRHFSSDWHLDHETLEAPTHQCISEMAMKY